MADVLHVKKREERGTAACRRLRSEGIVPAVLYGHGRESMSLSISGSELAAALRHGTKLVEIQGDVNDSALLREIQWDAMGHEVLHIDLTRVSAEELVEVELAVEIRGVAPGTREGGIVEQVVHEIEISCPAGEIPEKAEVNINNLHVGETLTAASVQLPAKAKLITDPETVLVQCMEPVEREVAEVEPGEGGVEPEVIGRAAEEDEEQG